MELYITSSTLFLLFCFFIGSEIAVSDETDHIIGTEPMHVIWARGQEAGKYVHQPASGLEKDPVTISDFYRPDELKYHGRGDQRGVTLITFLGTHLA